MGKPVFSLLDMDDLIRSAGAERVDEKASRKLSELLEDAGREVIFKARQLANYAGRKQITREDVLLAAQLK